MTAFKVGDKIRVLPCPPHPLITMITRIEPSEDGPIYFFKDEDGKTWHELSSAIELIEPVDTIISTSEELVLISNALKQAKEHGLQVEVIRSAIIHCLDGTDVTLKSAINFGLSEWIK